MLVFGRVHIGAELVGGFPKFLFGSVIHREKILKLDILYYTKRVSLKQ